eukprot:XP_001698884.1 predicted protein [Chlamydomonas reinhardtii]
MMGVPLANRCCKYQEVNGHGSRAQAILVCPEPPTSERENGLAATFVLLQTSASSPHITAMAMR